MTHNEVSRSGPRTACETVRRVAIQLVTGRDAAQVWDALLARHHY